MLRQPNVTVDSGLTMDQLKTMKSTTHQCLFTTTGNRMPTRHNPQVSNANRTVPAASLGHSHGFGYSGQGNFLPHAASAKMSSQSSITNMAQLKMSMEGLNRVKLCNESSFIG